MHKSGFVNIIGNPNVGKSTLLNNLVGERMSIITHKPQTTRHRILGILSDENYQIVFSDTPGIILDPAYKMQTSMNRYVSSTFRDGDIMLLVTDTIEKYEPDHPLLKRLSKLECPVFLIVNKIDLIEQKEVLELILKWQTLLPNITETFPISALKDKHNKKLITQILKHLPEGPAFYPKDQLTDKSDRFIVSEIIREKILEQFKQEIPYSVHVVTTEFKETKTNKKEPLIRIASTLFVMRESQKAIILGNQGFAIKRLATSARKSMEAFFGQKVFLDITIKVKGNWRDDEKALDNFGY